MMGKKKKDRDIFKETENYVAFLEKRLASENYKRNVSEEEYNKEKEKLKKAKLRLRLWQK